MMITKFKMTMIGSASLILVSVTRLDNKTTDIYNTTGWLSEDQYLQILLCFTIWYQIKIIFFFVMIHTPRIQRWPPILGPLAGLGQRSVQAFY